MTNVRTLRDINKGYRLGGMREQELEKKLYTALESKTEVNDLSEKLQDKYSKQVKDFDQERKGWNRERKQWESAFSNVTSDKQKLHTHTLELIGETKRLKIENNNLTSENIRKDLSLAESKAENITKSKKIKSLESMIKILEGKLSSAQKDVISIQNDLSKNESENLSLKSKIAGLENIKSELKSKVNELECLKSEAISKPIVGGNDEGQSLIVPTIKNITKSDNISLGSTDLSKYFICGKNMDPIEKIDGNEVNPKVKDGTSISEINKDDVLDISIKPNASEAMPQNVTPHLIQPDNNSGASAKAHMSSLIESNSQMRPGPEALPLPIRGIGAIPVMTSTYVVRGIETHMEVREEKQAVAEYMGW
ncbi:1781_t:CDS:2, partial [Paraglomus brasilianum]